ncbi:MAG: chloride channel protein [Planctomycetes bacterium]|nr:chloride channel protein [Planctomycetota bacterium]
MKLLRNLPRLARPALRLRSLSRWVLYGTAAGAISGLSAAGFYALLEFITFVNFDLLAGFPLPSPAGEGLFRSTGSHVPVEWLFLLLPAAGGLLSGLIVQRFAPEASGVGTEALIHAFHREQGVIRGRVPLVKAVGTLCTLGFGGASGREGPIAQIGGGLGSWLARVFRLGVRDRRVLLLAGAAGGFGAIFRAPLGGAVTAVEVLYREDLETEALVPCVISSVTAYAVFSGIFGFTPIFALPHALEFTRPHELLFYLVLGLLCAPLGALAVRAFHGIRGLFARLRGLPLWARPALGGLLVGALGFLAPGVYGSGWGIVQRALMGDVLLATMAILMVGKLLAMSFSLGSGGSGGVFGPMLFVGAMLGGVFGFGAERIFGSLAPDPAAVVIVGMCAFFAGVANAPLGALLMTLEMSRSYGLVAPLMLVSVVAVLFSTRWSIFRNQVRNRFHSPAHQGDLSVNVLEGQRVEAAMRPAGEVVVLDANATLVEIREMIAEHPALCFPVVDPESRRLVGVFSVQEARPVLFRDDLDSLVLARDVMGPVRSVSPDQDLYTALLTILDSGYPEIPVADPANGRLAGVLRHADLLRAYDAAIVRGGGPAGSPSG